MTELVLLDVLEPQLVLLKSKLQAAAGLGMVEQLERVIVPVQRLGGSADNFSFMAFPHPRLTFEDRKNIPLVEEVSYIIEDAGIQIKIDIDQFGQIHWFHIKNSSTLYETLQEALKRIAEKGDYRPFWK